MTFGICTGIENWAAAAAAGCAYGEMNFTAVTQLGEDEFAALLQQVEQSGLPCQSMNCFLPGTLRLTGPAADPDAALAFAAKGFARAQQLGVQVVVFGSAGARNVPDGFDMAQAKAQIAAFAARAAALAAQHGITLVIEPLSRSESNIIHTVADALEIRALAGDPPHLYVLGDLFHMHANGEDFTGLARAGKTLAHCHIAAPVSRAYCAPGQAEDYYRAFFAALKAIGYTGRISVEGSTDNFAADAKCAMDYLKALAE